MPTPFFADLVREMCQEGGTGPLTPTGAVPGHRRFAGAVPADAPFHYAIAGIAQPAQWEVGVGRMDGSGRLARDTVASSSNGGDAVDFAPGLKTLALTVGADWYRATASLAGDVAEWSEDMAGLATALDGKQPLSTTHAAVAAGMAGDLATVRRGGGWVNVPLSALAFRGADGRYELGGALAAQDGTAGAPSVGFAADGDTGLFRPAADQIGVATGGAERLRITNGGQVGIGTVQPRGRAQITAASFANMPVAGTVGAAVSLFLTNNDANYGLAINIAGTGAATMQAQRADGGGSLYPLMLNPLGGAVRVGDTLEPLTDNVQDIGAPALRFDTLFAGTGTINTSDARDKLWQGPASDAELRAARRIGAELGFYQWHSAVADKGADRARRHFGVRAQAVWAIMADEGLIDPLDGEGRPGLTPYAFLCWDEWEDERAAARRDRFGIRPDQLSLFLIAAQEARLAVLEAAA